MGHSTLQFVWGYSGHAVAARPKTVLLLVAGISTSCLLISLCFAPLPSFSDPTLGFETRGTELADRLVAFENLLDRVGSPSAGTRDQPVLSKTAGERKRRHTRPKKGRKRSSRRSPFKFCGQPSGEYSQIVVSGWDLWNFDAIQGQCLLESRLVSVEPYGQLCEHYPKVLKSCCPPWSLPNIIAFLNNRTDCHHVTDEDVAKTKDLVEDCRQYFKGKGSASQTPVFIARGVPQQCRKGKAIYNLLYYILDSDYEDKTDRLENVLIILPLAQSTATLPFYRSLQVDSLRIHNVSVTAINLGVKDAVFSKLLVEDCLLLLAGLLSVAVCLWLYTSSLFLMIATLLSILFSLSLAYFLYTIIFQINFFPFINLLSTVVAIGVGSDASLILCKVWTTQLSYDRSSIQSLHSLVTVEQGCPSLSDTVEELYRKTSAGLILTSLTTAAAFFASYVSNITSLACFGVFSGSVVLSNLVVTWWWMPACLVLSSPGRVPVMQRSGCASLVLKARRLWQVIFPALTLWSSFILYRDGGLPVLDRPTLQLFLATDPLEKFYDYSQKFHLYSHIQNMERIVLRWVWGVEPKDSGNYLDPGSRGSLHIDQMFNISHPESQLFIDKFCKNVRRQEWYGGGSGVVGGKCFPESLNSWLSRRCNLEADHPCCEVELPCTSSLYSTCAVKAAASIHRSLLSHPLAGPYFLHPDSNQTIRALIVEFESNFRGTASFTEMSSFLHQIEEWTSEQFASAPESISKGWFLSDFGLYDLQRSLRLDTVYSVLIASLLVLVLLSIATQDVYLASTAMLTVCSSTLCVAALLVHLGWKLDVLESSTASLAVGLSVDFTIHYALHYKFCGDTRRTLDSVGGPLLTCMITSCLAGIAMIPSQTLAYRRVAVFLLVLMPVSFSYSTLYFLSLLTPYT